MLRVLLLVEDYGESVFLQILLNKLGFEVEALKNPKVLNESIFRINPDILVMTARGKRVNGIEIAGQIKRSKGKPRVIGLAAPQVKAKMTKGDLENVDAMIDTPIRPNDFLVAICQLGNLDSQGMIEKYKKMKAQIQQSPELAAMMGEPESTENETLRAAAGPSRQDRYAKFLTLDKPPLQATFSKQKVTQIVKDMRRQPPDEDLEKERQSFIKAMFKKNG